MPISCEFTAKRTAFKLTTRFNGDCIQIGEPHRKILMLDKEAARNLAELINGDKDLFVEIKEVE